MVISFLLLALCIIGALTYALASNAKAAELGRLLFACALLVLCFCLSGVLPVRIPL